MHRSCTPGEPLQLLQLPYGGKDNLYFVLVNPVFEAPTKAVGPVFETPKDKAQWQCQSTGFVLILQHPHVGLASVCIWRHAPSASCFLAYSMFYFGHGVLCITPGMWHGVVCCVQFLACGMQSVAAGHLEYPQASTSLNDGIP
eukprot:scaffold105052_cov22-Tisochrysis_lutea.AAC.1